MKKICVMMIFLLSSQLSSGQEKDLSKDFDYNNFEKYYKQAINSSELGDDNDAFKNVKYAMKFAKKLKKKGLWDSIEDKVEQLKDIESKKESLFEKAQALRDSRADRIRNMASQHKSKKETLTVQRDAELKKVNEAKAKRKAESKKSGKINKLPPSLMQNAKLEKEFRYLVKSETANYTVDRVIFRHKDWGLNKNIHQKVISRGMMTAFVLKDGEGNCFLQYFHFEQAKSGSSFGKTYKTKWSDKRPNPLECSALD